MVPETKLKILLIQPCFENFGGYFRSIGLAKALAKKGHRVDLLISSKENSLMIKKKREKRNLDVYELPRLKIHYLLNGKILRGILACFFIVLGRYDVIHIFEAIQPETNLPLIFCKIIRKKVILDIDEEWSNCLFTQTTHRFLAAYTQFCDLKLSPRFEFLTVTSDYLVKKFKKLGVKNVFKIINGVDLDQFKPVSREKARKDLKINPQERMILSFGNTYLGERAYLLFKTFQAALKRDKSLQLYFNAPHPFRHHPKIEKEITAQTLKNVVITGYLGKKRLPSYLGACDLTMFLTEDTPGERACFPVRIGSYLNGERVIVINQTETEAYQSLARQNCVVTGKNPVEIANQIMRFFNDQDFRRQLETNVKRARKNLSWDKLTDKLVKFYRLTL
jgi:glycosyltransferase involved in cell wall biosynthesis